MGALADLKRRTGVGPGGVTLYVVALAAGLGAASLLGEVDHDGDTLFFLAGLLYAVGLLGVVAAVANAPRSLLLAAARRRGVREGTTALAGTAEPTAGTVDSPFRDEPALCYAYRVLQCDPSDDESDDEGDWRLVAAGDDGVPFAVVTPTGERVRVDPGAATCHLGEREELVVGADERPPGRVRSFRRETDIDPAPPDAARRYQEATLAPGDEAFVLGRAVDEGGLEIREGRPFVVADAGYPARVRDRVVAGFVLGVPVTAGGLLALLFVAGAL